MVAIIPLAFALLASTTAVTASVLPRQLPDPLFDFTTYPDNQRSGRGTITHVRIADINTTTHRTVCRPSEFKSIRIDSVNFGGCTGEGKNAVTVYDNQGCGENVNTKTFTFDGNEEHVCHNVSVPAVQLKAWMATCVFQVHALESD